jgi:uncharacterized protein (TIGR02996 family)
MRDDTAFLDAIRKDPNDDVTRLVYADWLDEQGDSRGEYLRLEHQLSQTAQRLGELQRKIEPAWLADVRRPPPGGEARDSKLIDIHQPNGRPLWCWSYAVAYTYDGYMVRTPSEECNEDTLARIPREVARYFGDAWPIHLVQPVRRPGEIDYPPVRVAAFFTSLPMRHEMHLSSLVVVWFQEEQFPVPDEPGRAALEAVDWERLALDYET